MAHVRAAHDYACTPEVFFVETLLSERYNRALYAHLGAGSVEWLACRDDGTTAFRRIRVVPAVRFVPPGVRRALEGRFSYVEEGTIDRRAATYRFRLHLGALGEKASVEGVLACAPCTTGLTCTADVDIRVGVVGFGAMLEAAAADGYRRSFVEVGAFTDAYLAELGGTAGRARPS